MIRQNREKRTHFQEITPGQFQKDTEENLWREAHLTVGWRQNMFQHREVIYFTLKVACVMNFNKCQWRDFHGEKPLLSHSGQGFPLIWVRVLSGQRRTSPLIRAISREENILETRKDPPPPRNEPLFLNFPLFGAISRRSKKKNGPGKFPFPVLFSRAWNHARRKN